MTFELRQYDNVLLKFAMERKELGEFVYRIVWINDELEFMLPVGLTLSHEGISSWLSSRVIPKNREFVDKILLSSGLKHNDTMGIIRLCKGLSLNDGYWVVEEGFEGSFDKYNLYKNRFARTLALIAYTGYGSALRKGFTSSPEYTTNGMLRKCWRRIDGKIYLFKGGTSGAVNAGNEPFSEFYAAQIAQKMEIKHVSYGLSKWKGILCSTCELFTDIDTSYVPMYKFFDNCTLTKTVELLKSLGYYDDFADMMIFDAVIFNTDRHFGNFGLLVDNKTNKPIAFAPIFDNGLSLFNYATDDDLRDIDRYAFSRAPAFVGVSFDELIKEFISGRQKEKLRKLIGFTFKRHPKYNLPRDRLKIIEEYIGARVRLLCK